MDTEIRVSTESRPWRRKFSRHSCRDLNPGPFSHESGALTTELSPSPSKLGTWIPFGLALRQKRKNNCFVTMFCNICSVHVCLAVTCHLHFDLDLLRATAVTWGRGGGWGG